MDPNHIDKTWQTLPTRWDVTPRISSKTATEKEDLRHCKMRAVSLTRKTCTQRSACCCVTSILKAECRLLPPKGLRYASALLVRVPIQSGTKRGSAVSQPQIFEECYTATSLMGL
ncbi:hypothetical protein HPB48_021716 [Haemaphysalis longicornis]|uniref:Uncharacterized protein n=1 Tax=Haemaphysalis longicornis TaxID=44386 RepID=A0A9J6FVB8_HAELO|nr:hypothetical protein HPB48_021716 [Haemaphysalis longicornis]